MKKYLMEFIGTFFLVLTIGLVIQDTSLGLFSPLAIGAVLIALIYVGGPISGAHYNPAVSLAVFLDKKSSFREMLLYVLMQLIGALLAACFVFFMTGSTGQDVAIDLLPAFLSEFLFTFALVFVILHVGFSEKTKGNSYFGLAIGLTVVGGIYAVGRISGGVFNPAVLLGLIVMGVSKLSCIGIYLASQFFASILAWKVFQITDS